jgi:hypothetical protein
MAGLPTVLLLGALAVALVMAYRLWEEMNEKDEPATDQDVFNDLERAHAEGEIDDAEFLRICKLMNLPVPKKLKRDPNREMGRTAHADPLPQGEDIAPPADAERPTDSPE